MTFKEIVVLAWLFGKLSPKEKPLKEERRPRKKTVIDPKVAEEINWGWWLWFFLVIAVGIAVIWLIAINRPFIAACIGGPAIFLFKIPLSALVTEVEDKEQSE